METVISIVTLAGMAYAAYWGLRCMLRAGQSAKREEPLTPNDLKVLEESAARLIADIKSTTNECVSRVERVLSDAESRITALQANSSMQPLSSGSLDSLPSISPTSTAVVARSPYEMINSAETSADIAREAGLTTGEVDLMRGLSKIGSV